MALKLQGTNSAAAPGLTNDGNDGIAVGTDSIDLSIAGASKFKVGSAGQLGIGGANYGTTGQVLKSAGASAAPTWGDAGTTVLAASAETSWTSVGTGTSFTLTGISASAKRLTLLADKISTDGNVNIELRIGDSDGVETTGYITESFYAGGSSSGASITTSFKINGTALASYRSSGAWEFWNLNGNLWYCQAYAHTADGTSPSGGHLRAAMGVKELSGTLDRIQVYIGSGNLDMGNVKLITWT